MIIQWVESPSPAVKTPSLISLPVYVHCPRFTTTEEARIKAHSSMILELQISSSGSSQHTLQNGLLGSLRSLKKLNVLDFSWR
ncbi:unnamed protein product [Prunus brigantina]